MEAFAVLVVIVVIIILVVRASTHSSRRDSSTPSRGASSGPTAPPAPKKTYKPRPTRTTSRIIFRPQVPDGDVASPVRVVGDLSGLRDAVTGTALDPARALYRCGRCEVFYHADSYELVREENAGRCVACGVASITSISTAQAKQQSGRNYEAGITTLVDYRSKEGQVVIFEGRCVRVLPSRRGSDYAVMFEDKLWTRGFKMVVFRRATASVGGAAFLLGLAGKQLRVRGLIVKHPRFGYQIIVNDRAMILEVR